MSTIPILLGLVLAVPANSDESVLGAARLPTTDKAILNFFHKRSQPPPGRAAIEQLARALGSNNPAEADDAHAELLSIGPPVVSVLRDVANRVDLVRASKRAKQILLMIEGPQADRLPIDAARLLAVRKSPGAAEALLGYLPVADNDQVFEEIVSALGSLSFLDGKADPALLAALKSPKAFTRAAAARALCKAGGIPSWKVVRPLLTDSDPAVRFQVAVALADAHDGQAIPVLIECLSDGPPALAAQAEEYLARLAGEWTVHAPRGSDIVSRELRRAVWAAWWAKTSGDLLLRELKARTLTDEELDRAQALLRKLEAEQVETGGTALHAPDGTGAAHRSARAPRPPAKQHAPEPWPLPAGWKASRKNFLPSATRSVVSHAGGAPTPRHRGRPPGVSALCRKRGNDRQDHSCPG